MDFFEVRMKEGRGKVLEIYPDFIVGRSSDLMVRGGSFYAVWDERSNLWSTDEYDVQRLVDEKIRDFVRSTGKAENEYVIKDLRSYGSNVWNQFRKFMKNISDNSTQLDMKLMFANSEAKKSDYSSRRLPYNLVRGSIKAWDELVGTFYTETERAKIEWAIGSVVSGDSKNIEKFLVFYGAPGSGKGTILKIIQKLFKDYTVLFEARALVGNNNTFSTEVFKSNPLVGIQHDGDLSKIEDNSKLNSITGHDEMRINEKFKPGYDMKIQAMLFMGTNKPVKITDAKSGLIRRLIDVEPTGIRIPPERYQALVAQTDFELGAIAHHCLDVYRRMGKNYYSDYEPTKMMYHTDVFFNFIENTYDIFKAHDSTTLKQAWTLYSAYCKEADLEYKLPMHRFREELKNYFEEFHNRYMVDGLQARSVYTGFKVKKFDTPEKREETRPFSLNLDSTESLFDEMYSGQPAQKAKADGTPQRTWSSVKTTLADVDTSELHYVKVPENHIVIDFDLRGEDGEKSLERNLEAASMLPPTYSELSKSGGGIHLHYLYTGGDVGELAARFSDGVETKVYTGNSSLRRRLSRCNSTPVATISGGLPLKEKKMLANSTLQSEKGLRELIARNLRKEIHPGTKPSVDFIKKILDDAYDSDMVYDVTDLKGPIMAFANNSSNQALACLKTMKQMKFKSDETSEESSAPEKAKDERIVFFDVEVYPNLFVICWKFEDSPTVVRMMNPVPMEVEKLFQFKLVGFNNRNYDNHIVWARMMGYTNEELYKLSQKIIVEKDRNAFFGEAYNLSYADIYDFSSKKQGLKKWEIELGIHHMELDIPWDQPVPDDLREKVVEYCANDVLATEATFKHCTQDFVARKLLSDLSGLPVNSTTRKHAEKIIFGDDRKPQDQFVYTDLSEEFPGYVFDEYSKTDKSTYRGETVGEGGYVYAEPGIYEDVALLDVASMHPTSIEMLNLFGNYTEKFSALKKARLAIKHKLYDEARELLGWDVSDEENAKALSDALKLIINSIYGYTSATFPNPFRDPRNKDNIVAKRGALFMIDLKHEVQKLGFTVAHIKTDSIKIPNATPEIIDFVTEYGKRYGYDFEHEGTYKKFCLVNDAVYIAKEVEEDPPGAYEQHWTAVGAQFQHPYVYKTLFSGEPLNFGDLCETKSVSQGVMYLDFGVWNEEDDFESRLAHMHHVGRTGLFIPVKKEMDGGILYRVKDGKLYAVTGTKGFYWIEAEMIKQLNGDALDRMPFEGINDALDGTGSIADIVDMLYFTGLAENAVKAIEEFGSFEEFVA